MEVSKPNRYGPSIWNSKNIIQGVQSNVTVTVIMDVIVKRNFRQLEALSSFTFAGKHSFLLLIIISQANDDTWCTCLHNTIQSNQIPFALLWFPSAKCVQLSNCILRATVFRGLQLDLSSEMYVWWKAICQVSGTVQERTAQVFRLLFSTEKNLILDNIWDDAQIFGKPALIYLIFYLWWSNKQLTQLDVFFFNKYFFLYIRSYFLDFVLFIPLSFFNTLFYNVKLCSHDLKSCIITDPSSLCFGMTNQQIEHTVLHVPKSTKIEDITGRSAVKPR